MRAGLIGSLHWLYPLPCGGLVRPDYRYPVAESNSLQRPLNKKLCDFEAETDADSSLNRDEESFEARLLIRF